MYQFSIIIPHYNLPESLENLLQTIPTNNDIQVIIIDDGSNDKSRLYLKRLSDKYNNYTFIYNNQNQGAGVARNKGLRFAKGKYVLFADTDDSFTSDAYDIWCSSISCNDDIIYFPVNCLLFDSKQPSEWLSKRERNVCRLKKKQNQLLRWLQYNHTEPWGKLFRREFIEDHKIEFETSKVANDYLFSVLTGLKAKKVNYIDQKFYNYMVRTGSLSNNQNIDIDKIISRLKVYKNIQNIFKQNGIYLRPFDRYAHSLEKDNDIRNNEYIRDYFQTVGWYGIKRINNIIISSIFRLFNIIIEKANLPYCGF